jgi:transposase-like protein
MKHKSDDYKISAVKYYLKNKDNIRKTCKIFDCSKSSLHRWIQTYKTYKKEMLKLLIYNNTKMLNKKFKS